jgi:site-specific DNA-methyltransferase (adenine-specific)
VAERAHFTLRGRNPDVLTCIANLSSDEVFTPPELANRILDDIADAWGGANSGANIWANKNVTFLDPFTKSGVFLREITRRLTEGLKDEIPDLQKRVDHIVTTQVYGIGITRLTSLLARRSVYCSKFANGPYSIAHSFDNDDGDIWFAPTQHSWEGGTEWVLTADATGNTVKRFTNGRCKYCGASQLTLDRAEGLETHAYAFIHADNIKARIAEIFGDNVQFDVIVGNPPYQLNAEGGTRDIPIYNKFVNQAKKLSPRLLSMVIPSRWMASGLGLTEFRQSMLADRHIRQLVDYERMDEVFPGVDFEGGVCYFLWERDSEGPCAVTTISSGELVGPVERELGEHDILVRDSRALPILRKVRALNEESITSILSVDKEFGWTSNFNGFHTTQQPGDVALYYNRGGKRLVGWIARNEVTKSASLIDTWKVMVPQAYGERGARPARILGPSFIAASPSVCTQTYLFFYVGSEVEAESLNSYLQTRFFRFLVSLRKITQHATRSTYTWVPVQTWDRVWTDEQLFKKYSLTAEEIKFIESMIRPVELAGE